MLSQDMAARNSADAVIGGIVVDSDGKPVRAATVYLKKSDNTKLVEKTTDYKGEFSFLIDPTRKYSLSAEKQDRSSESLSLPSVPFDAKTKLKLVVYRKRPAVLPAEGSKSPLADMKFADQPNFTVAAVTDFTAAGGHGSDATLRTSEALAVAASNLKPDRTESAAATEVSGVSEEGLRAALLKSPNSFDANHRLGEFYLHVGNYPDAIALLQSAYRIDREDLRNEYDLALACKSIGDPAHSKRYVQEMLSHRESGDLYRLAGDLDESLGNPLAAVREYEKAVGLSASEENVFAWGSELLIHRAIVQAQQVFERGVRQYPASLRMLTGLGTALFSGAAYQEAAKTLCKASDLKPTESEPYIFLGKVQMAAPSSLACVEERLHRFVREQPGSAAANYLYAMALLHRDDRASNPDTIKASEALLRRAVDIDPGYSQAYLQLGILCASRRDYSRAIGFYTKAIATDPETSDAHYRLAVAYDRTGQAAKAKYEFALHDAIAKRQAAESERQRMEVKQFLVVLPPESSRSPMP